jgi:catechol 2,3-dioxygenase-like lactoylglutathione lyase family enzyme
MRLAGRTSISSFLLVSLTLIFSTPAKLATERPPIVGIAHIALQVGDVAKARAFYGDLLGYEEPFRLFREDGTVMLTYFKINDRQFVEILPDLPSNQDERLSHFALETTDIEALRLYLVEKGIKAPGKVNQGRDKNLNMTVTDPDGHNVEFVQYLPDSLHSKTRGEYLSNRRISDRLLHVGITVRDTTAADRFYKEVLGMSEIWRGGMTSSKTDWINMRVPEGTDYLEYMLIDGKVNRRLLGVLHHLALQVPDIQKALENIRQRPSGWNPVTVEPPEVGRNNRWQLNLYDPDGTRAELMEPFTIK